MCSGRIISYCFTGGKIRLHGNPTLSILGVSDEGYSRNAPSALNLISTFLLYIYQPHLYK